MPPPSASTTDANDNHSPAYTPVNARRTLSRPETSQTAPEPPESLPFPPSVYAYASRVFSARLPPGVELQEIKDRLRVIVTQAAEQHRINEIDWANRPFPQDEILAERAAHKLVNSAAFMGNKSHKTQHAAPAVPVPVPATATTAMEIDSRDNTSDVVPQSRKRKSIDADDLSNDLPPWRQKLHKSNTLASRMTQPDKLDKRQKKTDQFRANMAPSKLNDLERRRQRFQSGEPGIQNLSLSSPSDASPMPVGHNEPIIGTCQKLEKTYYRLTEAPKAETVRPLPILKKALEMLKGKWKEDKNYRYICDQFKSMRQDLTVQHIKNDFTVQVYEAHARTALEKGDVGEYNQCQTQLRTLHKQGLGGSPGEFTAYRILYFIYTCNRTGMNDVLADLTLQDKNDEYIRHALETRSAVAKGNYHRLFKLYQQAPKMAPYLMDMFVDRERLAALAMICKTYKPDVKVEFLSSELAFPDDQQCAQFLCDHVGDQLFEVKPDGVRFLISKVGNAFDTAKQKAFRTVDIRGQI